MLMKERAAKGKFNSVCTSVRFPTRLEECARMFALLNQFLRVLLRTSASIRGRFSTTHTGKWCAMREWRAAAAAELFTVTAKSKVNSAFRCFRRSDSVECQLPTYKLHTHNSTSLRERERVLYSVVIVIIQSSLPRAQSGAFVSCKSKFALRVLLPTQRFAFAFTFAFAIAVQCATLAAYLYLIPAPELGLKVA